MSTLGARLRALRQQAGLTQRSLADGLCSKSMISQIESDKVQPSPELLSALALRLGATIEQLLPAKLQDQERLARFRQAQAFLSLSHYEEALPLLLACLHSPLPTWSLAELSYQTAYCLHQLQRYGEARPAYLEAIHLARKEQATSKVILGHARLGELARVCGDLSMALQEWKTAYRELQMAERVKESEMAAEVCLHLAQVYRDLGWYREAVRYFEEVKLYAMTLPWRLRVEMELGLGVALDKLGDWQQAEAHLRLARQLCASRQDWRTLLLVEWELGCLLGRVGQVEEALDLLEACHKRAMRTDNRKLLASVACEKARILQTLQRHEEAVGLLLDASSSVKSSERACVQLALAEVYRAAEMWEQALAAALTAEKELQPGASVDAKGQVYQVLSDLYKKSGDFQQASAYQLQKLKLLQGQARRVGWLI